MQMPTVGSGRLGDPIRPKYTPEIYGIPKSEYKRKLNINHLTYSRFKRIKSRIMRTELKGYNSSVDVVIRFNGNRAGIFHMLLHEDVNMVDLIPAHYAMFRPKALRMAQISLTKEIKGDLIKTKGEQIANEVKGVRE